MERDPMSNVPVEHRPHGGAEAYGLDGTDAQTPSRVETRPAAAREGEAGSRTAPAPSPERSGMDVRGLQSFVEGEFVETARDEENPAPHSAETTAPASARSPLFGRVAKTILGIAVVLVFGWEPLMTALQARSAEAVVNARLVTLRSPIEGRVQTVPSGDQIATATGAPAREVRIVDNRANRTRLDEAERQLAQLRDDHDLLTRQLAAAEAAHRKFADQATTFVAARSRQLEARAKILATEISAAEARVSEADATMDIAKNLDRLGGIAKTDVLRQQRDRAVAREGLQAARARLEETTVELEALRNGISVGDSYNDRPGSAQKADDMSLRVDELRARLKSNEAAIARAELAVADESRRYEMISDVHIPVPEGARIWELLTAQGEEVRPGQDLVRILDCGAVTVTANVTESVYNRLRIGAPATFRPSDTRLDLTGRVVGLSGMADASSNFAIVPTALTKQPFRVTVAVPRLAAETDCAIGRTGRVTFPGTSAEGAPGP